MINTKPTIRINKPLKFSAISLATMLAMGCVGPKVKEDTAKTRQKQEIAYMVVVAENETAPTDQALIKKTRLVEQEAQQASNLGNMHDKEMSRTSQAYAISADAVMMHKPMAQITNGPQHPAQSENYQSIDENGVKQVSLEPVSTFSIDVDTGSYTNTRRMLTQGYLPPADAVRIEEFVNYFDYEYDTPKNVEQPFSVNTALSVAPWNDQRLLLRIGLKGYEPAAEMSKGSNLVFLLDVSGSMNQDNKLPLLKRSLTMLTNQLSARDKVSIVVYAGASGVVLTPTDGNDKGAISAALNKLEAGGSTNGAAGIQQAYQLAEQAFIKDGVNRVILATDGDFNVGMTDQNALIDLIKQKKQKGIALTTLGFGQGNYNDYLMEQLADAGNGNYAYIDNINEARKVLVDELQSTMQIIAKDVKIQVEFNPATVAEYRLIGYENRALANEDFNNDKVDAGDIGAGHTVTALYELTLHNSKDKYNDELRYGKQSNKPASAVNTNELAQVKLRFKQPEKEQSELIKHIVRLENVARFNEQPDDFRFAAAVATFAQHLKMSKFSDNLDYEWIANTAQNAKGRDEFGYRSEFIQLVRNTRQLDENRTMLDSND
jgi:Ca-activated chloride channel homolog